jgi:hypothetical protein
LAVERAGVRDGFVASRPADVVHHQSQPTSGFFQLVECRRQFPGEIRQLLGMGAIELGPRGLGVNPHPNDHWLELVIVIKRRLKVVETVEEADNALLNPSTPGTS